MIRNWHDFYLQDAYNLEGKRTPKNTECWQVNCGGRALGLENWFCPYSTEDDSDRLFLANPMYSIRTCKSYNCDEILDFVKR